MKIKQYGLSMAAALLGMLLLTGCGKTGQNVSPGTMNYPIKSAVSLAVDGVSYRLDIDAESSATYTLQIHEPSVLEGMCLIAHGDTVSVSCDGIVGVAKDDGYAKEHGILLVNRLFGIPSGSFSEAGSVKKDGIQYRYSTYVIEEGDVTYYRQEGLSDIAFIEGNINGHILSLSFVNE